MTFRRSLIESIQKNGPMPLSEWMQRCNAAYYSQATIGQDFTTAPELSPLFGEMLGLWLLNQWQLLGKPQEFAVTEYGAGNGTLMADALRAIHSLKIGEHFLEGLQLYIVEQSPTLQKRQQTAINHPIQFITLKDQLPECPTLIIANEFFDALPIEQSAGNEGQFVRYNNALDRFEPSLITEDVTEDCPAATELMQTISQHLHQYTGGALIIDYGYMGASAKSTLQAVKNHQYISPFTGCGTVDLTAHVNFNNLHKVATEHNLTTSLTSQQQFLTALGLPVRLAQISDQLKNKEETISRVERLLCPTQMGTLFKVLECYKHPK